MRNSSFFGMAVSVMCCLVISAVSARGQTTDLESTQRLRLVEEQRIGSSTDPNLGFTNIFDMTVDRDGNVYAFDMPALTIKVFSPSGRLLRTIGRQGQGPGEFETSSIIGTKGDTVWARTRGAQGCPIRVVLFRRDGTYISTTDPPVISVRVRDDQLAIAQPTEMLGDGRMLSGEISCYNGGSLASGASPGGGGGGRGGSGPPVIAGGAPVAPPTPDVRVPRVLFDLAAGKVDTIGWFVRHGIQGTGPGPQVIIEGRNRTIPQPPRDDPLTVAFRDGRAVIIRTTPSSTSAATIRIVRTNNRGDTLANVALRYQSLRYTNATLDSIAARAAKSAGGGRIVNGVPQPNLYNNPTAAQAALRAEMKFPAFQMPVTRAVAGGDGTIWIRREDHGEATVLWHILEANGRPRGTVALPRNANPEWISESRLWTIQLDDEDVPWLVRYRIG